MTVTDPSVIAEQVIVSEHQLREKVVNEEFKIWKKTVPLLYDTINTLALEYPLLCTDFFPEYTVSDDKNYITAKLALGTNSSGKDIDYVHIAEVTLPSTLAPDFSEFAIGESIPIPGKITQSAIKISALWKHPGEVNRLRVSPNGTKLVSFDNKGAIHLYSVGEDSEVRLPHHTAEGYCLEWISEEQFLSGANDTKIALWDLSNKTGPIKQFNSHSAVINDLSFNFPSKNLFGSVADDYTTQIHDLRAPEESPAIKFNEKYIQNAILFHPNIATLFATAGKDNLVTLYDARNIREPLRKFYGHNDSVLGLKLGTATDPNLLYSWGLDKRVLTWDLNQLGEEYVPPSMDAGSEPKRRLKHNSDPCLQFIHGGHTKRVNDFAVHSKIPELCVSVGDDCLIEIFKPKVVLEGSEELEDEEKDEESEKEKEKLDEDDENDDHSERLDDQDMDQDNDQDQGEGQDQDQDKDQDQDQEQLEEQGQDTPREDEEGTPFDMEETKQELKNESHVNTEDGDVDMDKEETPAE